ncbi:MAG: hypothetical protein GC136_00035 [Alphaproteobacteria bacterium]|nr:hypothetical protein [Alphaproteobacteria bacterium]
MVVDSVLYHAQAAKQYGMQIHYLDDQVYMRKGLVRPDILQERFMHEQEMLPRIKARIGDDKAFFKYGADHYGYSKWLMEHMGRDVSVSVNIYADYESYLNAHKRLRDKKTGKIYGKNVDFQPDYVFLVKEELVIRPGPKLGRNAHYTQDAILAASRRGEQQIEADKFKQRVEEDIATRLHAGKVTVSADEVLRDMKPHWLATPARSPFVETDYPHRRIA